MNLTEASTLSQRSSDEDLTRFLSMANNLSSTGSASSMPWNAADDGGLHRSALSVFDAPPSLGLSWTDEESGKYMQSNPTSAVHGHDFELALPNVSYTTDSRTNPANHGLSNQYRITSSHGSLLDGGSSDLQWCNFANGYDTTGHDTLMPHLDLASGHSEFFNRAGSTSAGPINSLLLSTDNTLLSSSLDTSNSMNTSAGPHEGSLMLPNLTYPDSPISSSSSHRQSDSRSSHHPYLPLPQYSLRYHPTTQSFSAEPSYSSGEELFVPPSVLSSLGGDGNEDAFQVKHDGGALGSADLLDTTAAISGHPTHRSSSRSSNSAASQGSVLEGVRKRGTRSTTRLDFGAMADSDDPDEGDDEDAYQPSRSTSPYLSSGNDSGSQYSSEWSSHARKRIKGKANYKGKPLGRISAAEALAQVSSDNSSRNGSTEGSSQSHGGFDGRSRKNRNIPLPIPIPHLTKKSRGRKVPHVDNTSSRHANSGVHSEDAASGSVRGLNSGRRGRGGSSRSAGGRSFVCTVPGCGKCFIRGEHLKRHIRSIHTNEKPHPCPYVGCDKSFSRRDNLGQHVRLHLLNTST